MTVDARISQVWIRFGRPYNTTMHTCLPAIFLLALSTAVLGDTVFMKDGSVRQGKMLEHDQTSLRLQIDANGISSTMSIPLNQVSRVVVGTKLAVASATAP